MPTHWAPHCEHIACSSSSWDSYELKVSRASQASQASWALPSVPDSKLPKRGLLEAVGSNAIMLPLFPGATHGTQALFLVNPQECPTLDPAFPGAGPACYKVQEHSCIMELYGTVSYHHYDYIKYTDARAI